MSISTPPPERPSRKKSGTEAAGAKKVPGAKKAAAKKAGAASSGGTPPTKKAPPRAPKAPAAKKAAPRQQGSVTGKTAAQKRLAAQRAMAAASGARAARRKRLMKVFLPIGAVVVAAAIIVTVAVVNGLGPKSGAKSGVASASLVSALSSVPAATANTVGKGSIKAAPAAITAPPLTSDGKPRILYAGAEYCPYCAAERWAMAVALSRFGTFTNLGTTESAPSPEVYPRTQTLSFHGATYTSQYISFTGKELQSNQSNGSGYTTLDTLTKADEALVSKYDAPPYVPSSSSGAIPFVDFGGKYIVTGASYDPTVLQGKSRDEIAKALSDPNSAISQAVVGAANVLTAAICKLTDNQPGAVCSLSGVKTAASALGSGGNGGSSSGSAGASGGASSGASAGTSSSTKTP